jgi:uncharacterized protein (DUF1778 family)
MRRRTRLVAARVTQEEEGLLKLAASVSEVSVSELLRELVLPVARQRVAQLVTDR